MPRSVVFTHETPQMAQSGCHPSSFQNDSRLSESSLSTIAVIDLTLWSESPKAESYLARKWALFLYHISSTRSEIIEVIEDSETDCFNRVVF